MDRRAWRSAPAWTDAIRAHGVETYPHECCGALDRPRRRRARRRSRCRTRPTRARAAGSWCGRTTTARPRRAPRRGAWTCSGSTTRIRITPRGRRSTISITRGRSSRTSSSPCAPAAPARLTSWRLRDDRSAFDEEPSIVRQMTRPRHGERRRRPLTMSNRVLIPTPLRPFTDKQDAVEVAGATVGELLADLTTPVTTGSSKHLYTDEGRLRSFVNIYVNDEDIRYLQKEQTPVEPGDTLSIVPSVAGGSRRRGRRTELPLARRAMEIKRYSRHLILPEVGMDGQRKLKAAKRAVHRRRRARLAGGAVSRRRRRRHASASSTSTSSTSATCSARSPRHERRRPLEARVGAATSSSRLNPDVQVETYETALSSENALDIFKAVRRHRRRHGQLPDALPRERRVRAARQAERVRQHLPLRGAGVGVRDARAARATAASIPSRRRPGSSRAAPRAACSACCRASSAPSRPPRRSS